MFAVCMANPRGQGSVCQCKDGFRGDGVECAGKWKVKTVQCDYHVLISWTLIGYVI